MLITGLSWKFICLKYDIYNIGGGFNSWFLFCSVCLDLMIIFSNCTSFPMQTKLNSTVEECLTERQPSVWKWHTFAMMLILHFGMLELSRILVHTFDLPLISTTWGFFLFFPWFYWKLYYIREICQF